MTAFKNIKLGFSSYGKAFSIIFNNNLWWVLFIPVILNIILFWTGFEIKEIVSNYINNKIFELTNLENAEFFMSDILKSSLSLILGFSFSVIFFFIIAYFGGYLIIIIMSPFLAYISEKAEEIITGKTYQFKLEQFAFEIFRGILIATRNFLIQTGIFLGVMIIGFVPILGWFVSILSTIFLIIISSYFYGFSFMDYSNERKRLSITKSVKLIRKYKWAAISNGLIFSIILILPFCGGTLAAFFAIFSAAAGSISMVEIHKSENI